MSKALYLGETKVISLFVSAYRNLRVSGQPRPDLLLESAVNGMIAFGCMGLGVERIYKLQNIGRGGPWGCQKVENKYILEGYSGTMQASTLERDGGVAGT